MCLKIPETGKSFYFAVTLQIFGIDNLSGELIWQTLMPDFVSFQQLGKDTLPLFVLRTTAHFPHQPEYAVLGKHKVSIN